jgi:hypothetical protein
MKSVKLGSGLRKFGGERNNGDRYYIRARVKSDLEVLRQECIPSLGAISEDAGTDYRFRAKARCDEVGKAARKMVKQIDYENFNDEVADKQRRYRAEVYHKVWGRFFNLQQSMR